jgi:hypothetical protein
MKSGLLGFAVATAVAVAVFTLSPVTASGQEGPAPSKKEDTPKGRGGRGRGGRGGFNPFARFGPYYQPPVVKGASVGRTPDGHPDLQGIWEPRFNQAIFEIEDHLTAGAGIPPGKGAIVDPPDGHIPYQPWAAAKAKQLHATQMYLEPEAHCYESGVPHSIYAQFGFQILQTPGHVLLLWEWTHQYRNIRTDGSPHIPTGLKLFMGDSIGHWEGDTLVVDTIDQNGRTWFDMAGNFTTPNIHVVERFTPVDTNTISYRATIDDKTEYTRPWTIAGTLGRDPDPNYEQMEFACYEGNQDLNHYVESQGGKKKEER